MSNHERRELEQQTQNMIDNQTIMNNRRMVRKAINETLEESNIKPINPNDLLFLHTRHIQRLEQKLEAQGQCMRALDERLTFAEQMARESHSVVEQQQQPKFQEMLDNATKANQEAKDLAKLCIILAKRLKK